MAAIVREMAEHKKTIKLFGRDTEVVDVPVTEAAESFNEYRLEDGSLIRVKNVVSAVLRVTGQKNIDGHPVYLVLTSPVVNVLSSKATGD